MLGKVTLSPFAWGCWAIVHALAGALPLTLIFSGREMWEFVVLIFGIIFNFGFSAFAYQRSKTAKQQ